MKKAFCDEESCGKEIPKYMVHWTLIQENTPQTFVNNHQERSFCNSMCLAKYAASTMGKELIDADTGPDVTPQGGADGGTGLAQGT